MRGGSHEHSNVHRYFSLAVLHCVHPLSSQKSVAELQVEVVWSKSSVSVSCLASG